MLLFKFIIRMLNLYLKELAELKVDLMLYTKVFSKINMQYGCYFDNVW